MPNRCIIYPLLMSIHSYRNKLQSIHFYCQTNIFFGISILRHFAKPSKKVSQFYGKTLCKVLRKHYYKQKGKKLGGLFLLYILIQRLYI